LRRLALLLLILSLSRPALAQDDLQALAERFIEQLGFNVEFTRFRDACVSQRGASTPEALVASNPDYFGGIRPGSRKWPAVVKAYESYVVDACSRPTRDEFKGELASFYARVLTAPQLRQAIAFYGSATGKALVAANQRAAEAVREAWSAPNSLHLAEATAELERRVAVLAEAE
jgi:Uncharacterized protein conserved in bacteria (DUF2059)